MTYSENLFAIYLKFKFNWVSHIFSGNSVPSVFLSLMLSTEQKRNTPMQIWKPILITRVIPRIIQTSVLRLEKRLCPCSPAPPQPTSSPVVATPQVQCLSSVTKWTDLWESLHSKKFNPSLYISTEAWVTEHKGIWTPKHQEKLSQTPMVILTFITLLVPNS